MQFVEHFGGESSCFALYQVLKLRKAGEEKNTCLLVCRCLAADEAIFVVLQWDILRGFYCRIVLLFTLYIDNSR